MIQKYRAYHKKEKKMCLVQDLHFNSLGVLRAVTLRSESKGYVHFPHITDLKNIILIQFTGLKDKNNKEIFEGDIVKNEVEGGGVIFFSNIIGGFLVKRKEKSRCINTKDVYGNEYSDTILISRDEIIGNIHENPELLKEVNRRG